MTHLSADEQRYLWREHRRQAFTWTAAAPILVVACVVAIVGFIMWTSARALVGG